MISAAWARIRRLFGSRRGTDAGSDDGQAEGSDVDGNAEGSDGGGQRSDPSAFSLLDASVNYSHGQSDGEAVRELQRASEKASQLEEAGREQR